MKYSNYFFILTISSKVISLSKPKKKTQLTSPKIGFVKNHSVYLPGWNSSSLRYSTNESQKIITLIQFPNLGFEKTIDGLILSWYTFVFIIEK